MRLAAMGSQFLIWAQKGSFANIIANGNNEPSRNKKKTRDNGDWKNKWVSGGA